MENSKGNTRQNQRKGSFAQYDFEFQFTNLQVLSFLVKSVSFFISIIVYVL